MGGVGGVGGEMCDCEPYTGQVCMVGGGATGQVCMVGGGATGQVRMVGGGATG